MGELETLTDDQLALLRQIAQAWPDALTVHPETADLRALWDADLIDVYDMWSDGRRQWTPTIEGRTLIARRTETGV